MTATSPETSAPLTTFTVCAAYYSGDSRATVQVEARDFAHACELVIQQIDDGEIIANSTSWEPTNTFVYGVVAGDGDPFAGMANVPEQYVDPVARPDLNRAMLDLIQAARDVTAAARASTLPPVLSQALAALTKANLVFADANTAKTAA